MYNKNIDNRIIDNTVGGDEIYFTCTSLHIIVIYKLTTNRHNFKILPIAPNTSKTKNLQIAVKMQHQKWLQVTIQMFAIVALNLHNGEAAKILGFFAGPGHSHIMIHASLMNALAKRGHEVQ